MKIVHQLSSILIFAVCLSAQGKNSKRPHIIFIIVDDLGWNDVSFHGSKQIPTPNIDALAKSGVILNNYYVQPICTPSRGSLMTGKYPIRLGLQHDVIYSSAPWGLSPDEKILPQYLKDLGYKTHGVGKWHLGYFHKSYVPVNRGFDSFFGYWNGKEDHFTHFEVDEGFSGLDFHDDNINDWNYTGIYSTKVFTSKAKDIISTHNASEPLFLYLSHQAVHAGNSYAPLQAPDEYIEIFSHIKDPERRRFAGMTSALDDAIGETFAALSDAKLLDNSILVFTSDNGAAVEGIDLSTGSNWPLRGSKYNMWEGGIRGTAFVWSPLIHKAKVSSELMHVSDWLPTILSIAGGDLKQLPKIDGFNQWPSICSNASGPRNMILHNIDPVWKVEAVRKERFKLLKGSVFDGNFDGWFDKEGKKKENIPFTSTDYKKHCKVYNKLWIKSQVVSVLSKNYGKMKLGDIIDPCIVESGICNVNSSKICKISASQKSTNSVLEVQCGEKPKNSSSICKPMEASCLFDIINDPCEYNNLAAFKTQIVKNLEEELNKYRAQAVPIRNQPLDSSANPKYHGYAWVTWKKTP